MKLLLIIMAVLEGLVGIGLLIMPAFIVSLLLNSPFDAPAGIVVGRIAGAALFSLAIACWQARNSERGGAAKGIVAAMLVYNQAAAFLFAYSNIRLGLQSTFIWPVVVLHQALAVWCIVNLLVTDRFAKK